MFIDGANYYYTTKELGWRIDAGKLIQYFASMGTLTDALYYIGEDTGEDKSNRAYLDMLNHSGFSLVTKPIKLINTPNGEPIKKANMDVEIVTDMLTLIDTYDKVILFSGDSDFLKALNILRAKGKTVEVISTNCMISSELRRFCGLHYTDINDLRSMLEYLP